MKKQDEIYFWNRIITEVGLYGEKGKTPREIINEPGFPINYKRAWYLLEKWTTYNIYEYGVSLDLGWVTPEGIKNTQQARPPEVKL